jgi:predicted dehydrogenase
MTTSNTNENRMRSRRNFIRQLGSYIGASAFLLSFDQFALLKSVYANDLKSGLSKVKIGIIGTGDRGRKLLLHLKSIPEVEIIALCDNYEPNLQLAIKECTGSPALFSDYRKMLELTELHAVVIATPLYEHTQMAVDSMQAGKHLFLEKAMAKTIVECQQIVQAQKDTGRVLQIGHQRLFDLKYLRGIERIKKGEIGQVNQIKAFWHRNGDWRRPLPSPELERKINWRLYKEYSLGLMTELASHQIQVANWILEANPIRVLGSGSINFWKDGREVPDNVNLIYEYPGGVHLIYDSMISNKFYGAEEQILGSKGTVELEAGKLYKENYQPPAAPGINQLVTDIEKSVFSSIPLGGASWVLESQSKDEGDYLLDKISQDDGTQVQMEAFVATAREGKVNKWLIKQGYYASIASIMGYEAIETKTTIDYSSNFDFAF